MEMPEIKIRCEELLPAPKGRQPKRCKKIASYMIVMQHVGKDCIAKTFALCPKHAAPADQELSANLIAHDFFMRIGADIQCPDCGQEITCPEHIGNIEKI